MKFKKWKDYYFSKNYYCRRAHTKQERTANCEIREDGKRIQWGRGKRTPCNLDPWVCERTHNIQKSWKKKRKKQYNNRVRKTQYNTVIWNIWQLYEYERHCEENNVTYRVEDKHIFHYKYSEVHRKYRKIIKYQRWLFIYWM